MAKDWSRQRQLKKGISSRNCGQQRVVANRELILHARNLFTAELESVINTFQLSQEFRREIVLEEAHLRVCRRTSLSTVLWQLWNIIY